MKRITISIDLDYEEEDHNRFTWVRLALVLSRRIKGLVSPVGVGRDPVWTTRVPAEVNVRWKVTDVA